MDLLFLLRDKHCPARSPDGDACAQPDELDRRAALQLSGQDIAEYAPDKLSHSGPHIGVAPMLINASYLHSPYRSPRYDACAPRYERRSGRLLRRIVSLIISVWVRLDLRRGFQEKEPQTRAHRHADGAPQKGPSEVWDRWGPDDRI